MTRILLDQGLSRSAVESLRQAGWDVVHVYDLDMSQATDCRILDYARLEGRIVVTLDADFHALLAVANESSPSVIRLRREGLRGPDLAKLLVSIWPMIETQVSEGALVTVTEKAIRIRRLPISPVPEG